MFGKKLFIRFIASAFRELLSVYVFSYFPFGFEGRMWDLIVSLLIFLLYGYPISPSASVMAQNIQLFGPHEVFLTHQWIITGNKYITDKYYDETEMRTRQKRVATDTWRSLGYRATF